jgi:hypothetical protein
MTMTLIETKTLGTAAASIEFTSIPQDGTDLVAFFSFRTTSGAEANVYLTINGSTASFTSRNLYGDGSSRATNTTARYIGVATGGSQTANTFTNGVLTIPNYAGATNKSFFADDVEEANQTQAYQSLVAGLWSNTSAITSIAFTGATWAIGSIVSLYKITKGTDGIVVVS